MTAVGVPVVLGFGWGRMVVLPVLNAAGAVADLWMALMLTSYPPHVRIVDHEAGVGIIGRTSDRSRSFSVSTVVWGALSGAVIAVFAPFLPLGGAGPLLLSALGVDSLTIGTQGTVTYRFSFVDTPEEFSIGVAPGVLGLGALLGIAYTFVRSYRRGRRPVAATV